MAQVSLALLTLLYSTLTTRRPVTYQSGRRRAVVNFEDLQRLDEGEFLNDALIDFYMM